MNDKTVNNTWVKLEAFQVYLLPKGETFTRTSERAKSFYDKTRDGANPK